MAGNEESSDEDEISRIRLPRANDVLCGRGGHGTSHPGNLGFRMLVEKYKPKFQSAPRSEKSKIATAVVMAWRKQNPPGRFLSLSSESRGGYNLWHDIGDKLATRKANQGLREKGPNPGHLGIAPPPPPSAAAAPSSDISSVA
ncbi:Transcriptional regulator (Partial), partial [Seminavis robusta]|eukprot:Sro4319_g353710.1 Transcriptional regulator (142) ;mRNA; f:1497-2150